jgi:hypothetical protein
VLSLVQVSPGELALVDRVCLLKRIFRPLRRLLNAQLLIALYGVRSRNFFAEQRNYDLLFRWFLDMDLTELALTIQPSARTRIA